MPRAGVAQFSGSKNLEENVEAVRRLTARAAEAGVNLLGFHELASTLYCHSPRIQSCSIWHSRTLAHR